MVFDMSDESSLLTLQSWAVNVDMQRFEVLLCIGNKADLVPGHGAHVEYRRRMQRLGESTSDPHPEYSDLGINKKSTDDESNYDFEYEVLSHGSDDQWEFVGETSTSRSFEISNKANGAQDHAHQADDSDNVNKTTEESLDNHQGDAPEANNLSEDEHYGLDDLERLMSEIGNMRSNLRLMPDFQREMAANLAMKMAAMFGDDDEEAFEHI
ncbi:hypothetical protein HU200_032962 [Digitaria exilis]|uniref:Uncharacterized protein n=1 Tax=Digitaria exilis TaxID=1010633 RepID=A0A835BSZ3_9POAL|nr:hypothetical protein HU200_032962 [Digitaria exilis]